MHDYEKLLKPCALKIAEPAQPYLFLTERHLQVIWLEQKYFRPLTTDDGKRIEVVSPGIWNAEAGPDFLKAHLRIDGRDLHGDVEIHLNDDGWFHHQHAGDPRYNQVILHVSLWTPREAKTICTQQGKVIPRTYFEPCLTVPQLRIVQLIDLELYPYKKFLGSGRCAHAIFRKVSEEKIGEFFQNASEWRLAQKRTHLQAYADRPEQQFTAGLAMCLGYKQNPRPFLTLFEQLSTLKGVNETQLLAKGMEACGFFSEGYRKKWGESRYYQSLAELSAGTPALEHVTLQLHQIRPMNHPIRRLVYLAKWMIDPQSETRPLQLFYCWETEWAHCSRARDWSALWQKVRELLPVYQDPYWNTHYLFEEKETAKALTLLGDDLKNEIVVNVFLPLLHGEISKRGYLEEWRAFRAFYGTLPAARTSKTKYLTHRFFGDTPKGQLLNKTNMEQGAYQLHRDFCMHFEASCEGCPFVERYQAFLSA